MENLACESFTHNQYVAFPAAHTILIPINKIDISDRAGLEFPILKYKRLTCAKQGCPEMRVAIQDRCRVAGKLRVVQSHEEIDMLGAGIAVFHIFRAFPRNDPVEDPVEIDL